LERWSADWSRHTGFRVFSRGCLAGVAEIQGPDLCRGDKSSGIANARVTARLGQFQIKAIVSDITRIQLQDDFRDFDFVLWNMPFVWKQQTIAANKVKIEGNRFHDGDDGTLLRRSLAMLPALFKDGGEAMVLKVLKATEDCVLFVLP
jgi:tRNA1(Val) A37 N6-methylase TrmN6